MSLPPQGIDQQSTKPDLIDHAVGLLSQQAWCWGRDIQRPEGNWLLEIGFDRIEPPADRKNCSSVYSLQLPRGRCVVLRGFGAFYGDRRRGGLELPEPLRAHDPGLHLASSAADPGRPRGPLRRPQAQERPLLLQDGAPRAPRLRGADRRRRRPEERHQEQGEGDRPGLGARAEEELARQDMMLLLGDMQEVLMKWVLI